MLGHDLRTFFSAGSGPSVVRNRGNAVSHLPIFSSSHLPAALPALPSDLCHLSSAVCPLLLRLRSGQASVLRLMSSVSCILIPWSADILHPDSILPSVICILSSVLCLLSSVPRFRGHKLLSPILLYSLPKSIRYMHIIRCYLLDVKQNMRNI